MGKQKMTFFAKVTDDGEIRHNNITNFKAALREFYHGKPITITIERTSRIRSSNQNRWYWGCIVPMVQHALFQQGWEIEGVPLDEEDVHELLKNTYLKDFATNKETGEQMSIARTTTKLTTTEFMAYCNAIIQWASENLGVFIPSPNLEEVSA